MVDTLVSILTDESVRETKKVKKTLQKNFSAGTPWYNRAATR
jgi:hypothetical protein